MNIPVFVSCPTCLSDEQDRSRKMILRELSRFGLEPRALGRSDYPTLLPLREVLVLAQHCAGGLILGFEQFRSDKGTWKRGTDKEKATTKAECFPTSWNHLEAGVLFGLRLPILVFREPDISGGVFDPGVSDVFIHTMPTPSLPRPEKEALREVFMKWQADVRRYYYREEA